jgi:hypothetical protein
VEPWKREKESSKEETTMKEQDKGLKDKGKEDGKGCWWKGGREGGGGLSVTV